MPKRRRKAWDYPNKPFQQAMRDERESQLSKIPVAQRWKLTGRRIGEFSAPELAQLAAQITSYIATGRCRVTSGGGQPKE